MVPLLVGQFPITASGTWSDLLREGAASYHTDQLTRAKQTRRAIGSNDDMLQLTSRVVFANGVFDRAKPAGASPFNGSRSTPIA